MTTKTSSKKAAAKAANKKIASKSYEGFIVTSHYTVDENGATVHLYGRLKDGSSFEIRTRKNPYFFVKADDAKRAGELAGVTPEKTKLKTMDDDPVSKVTMSNPKDVAKTRKMLEDENIPCYEADIPFTRRYLIDEDILTQVSIEGEHERGEHVDKVFVEPTLTPIHQNQPVAEPTLLSIDIETDAKATMIHSISLYNKDVSKVIVVENEAIRQNKSKLKNAHIVESEKELLRVFVDSVNGLDPDIITGWHVIDFDFNIIAKRAKKHEINLTIGRDNSSLSLRIESNFLKDSSATLHGRLVIDGIHLLKSSFVKLDDYKLNTAAQEFLDDSKLIEEDDRFEIIEQYYQTEPQKFIDYNLKDSKLVHEILDASGVYTLTVQRSLLTGLHMDGVKASIASFDSLYLRELRKEGFVAMSTRPGESNPGLGGFVMRSKPGIYDNILVLDFKSLYPSIMRTFNIDPLSYVGTTEELDKKKVDYTDTTKYIVAPNGAVFANDEGIVPRLLARMWKERDKAKKAGDELARYAIKIHMNSMYGVLASPNSRYHRRPLSNAITYFGQKLIKRTAKEVEDDGYDVIYSDTDSVFVDPKTKDTDKAINIGQEVEKKLNAFFKNHIENEYSRKSILELEFEKTYTKFFIPSVRGESGVGAKKRYAGLKRQDDGSTKLDFTGLEFVRRDWTELAKEFQMKLLDLIFAEKEVGEFVKEFVKKLKGGEYDDLLVYRKALRKPVEEYTKTTPPHVKAAKKLHELTSNIIDYVITTDGPEPTEKLEHPPDYDHYIEKQVKPIAESILRLEGKNFDDVMKGSEQKGLGGFF
ncbi:MAG: DNA polymerase II [Candidatus Woesearchaeota archaeon]